MRCECELQKVFLFHVHTGAWELAVLVILLINDVCSQLNKIYSVLGIKAGRGFQEEWVILWVVRSALIFDSSLHAPEMLHM